jgi:hypothetical protein
MANRSYKYDEDDTFENNPSYSPDEKWNEDIISYVRINNEPKFLPSAHDPEFLLSALAILSQDRIPSSEEDLKIYGSTAMELISVDSPEKMDEALKLGQGSNETKLMAEGMLRTSCRKGFIETTKMLMKYEPNVNTFDPRYNMSPLLYANNVDNDDLVLLLLKNGADPNFIEPIKGDTVLHQAVARGNINIGCMLLEYNAQYDIKNINGETAGQVNTYFWRKISKLYIKRKAAANNISRFILNHLYRPEGKYYSEALSNFMSHTA